jgi:uncharacterized protein YodC (DUF2158 family)
MTFRVGEVVMLRSGGPEMTVTDVRPDGIIMVAWFGGAVLKTGAFQDQTLDSLCPA